MFLSSSFYKLEEQILFFFLLFFFLFFCATMKYGNNCALHEEKARLPCFTTWGIQAVPYRPKIYLLLWLPSKLKYDSTKKRWQIGVLQIRPEGKTSQGYNMALASKDRTGQRITSLVLQIYWAANMSDGVKEGQDHSPGGIHGVK